MSDPQPPAPIEIDTSTETAKLMLLAPLTHLKCPGCNVQFSHPIHERTLIQNEAVLVCKSDGCRQKDKLWETPMAVLTAYTSKP